MSRIRTKTSSYATASYQLKRAILENLLVSNYTTEDREAALRHFGGCAFCGAKKAPRNDHLVSVMDGGDFVKRNVVPACRKCDDSKGKKAYKKWMRESSSPSSLLGRGLPRTEIDERIRLIERWQNGYKPRSERHLLGRYMSEFRAIQQEASELCERARRLVRSVQQGRKP